MGNGKIITDFKPVEEYREPGTIFTDFQPVREELGTKTQTGIAGETSLNRFHRLANLAPVAPPMVSPFSSPSQSNILGGLDTVITPALFKIDKSINDWTRTQPIEEIPEKRNAISSVLGFLTRPFLAQGYSAAAALNRGLAALSTHLDLIDRWGKDHFGLKSGLDYNAIAQTYDNNAKYWQDRAEKVGVNVIDELIGEAVGGAPTGIGEFLLNIPYAATLGAAQAHAKGESEVAGAIVEGAKRGVLGAIFRAIDPLKQYLRAPTMGTIFGIQTAIEGGEPKEIAKSFGTGLIYSMTSPGGNMGLNEIRGRLDIEARNYFAEKAKTTPEVLEKTLPMDALDARVKELGLVPAVKYDDKVYEAKPGEIHPQIVERNGLPIDKNIVDGYMDKNGKFYTREELLSPIRKGEEKLLSEFEVKKTFDTSLEEAGINPKDIAEKVYPTDIENIPPVESIRESVWQLYQQGKIEPWEIGNVQRVIEKLKTEFSGDLIQRIAVEKEGKLIPTETGKPLMTDQEFIDHANNVVDKLIADGKAMPFEREKLLNQMLRKEETPLDVNLKPRQFLKTVEESFTTEEAVKQGVKGIEPQEYVVQPNAESLAKAESRISKNIDDAEAYVKSVSPVDAEKGATFISLIDKFQQQGQFDKAIELIENYDRQLREAGRFVQSASIWNRLTPQGFIRWAEKEVNKVNANRNIIDNLFGGKPQGLSKADKEYLYQEMLKINQMPEGIDKTNATLNLIDLVAQKVPPSVSEKFDAYRYQNMLSGWRTQERNIGTNIFNTFITRPWDIGTKGMIDYVEATLTGREREAYVKDVPLYMKNTINAIPNAIEAFKNAWKMETAIEKPEMGTIEGKGLFEKARAKQLPKALTIVSRFMEASDRFNSALISAGEFEIQKRNGLSDAEAEVKAHEIAENYLFRSKLNPLDQDLSLPSKTLSAVGQAVQSLREAPVIGKAAGWFVPFIRTPVNVGIQMIEHSPIGAIRGHWSNEIAARVINGSIVTGLGALFALQNKTTFSPPSGDKDKEWFYATNRKPFSVLIGDKWIPFWYLGPFALAFAIPAAVKWYTTETKHSLTNDALDTLTEIAGGITRFIASQTSVSGISSFYSLIDGEVDFSLPKQLGYIVGQAIPVSSLLRQFSTMLDLVFRKAKGFKESIMASIPGLSQMLPAYMEPFGEEAKRDFYNSLIPYDIGTMNKEFEEFYPSIQLKGRANYLKNKFQSIKSSVKKGEISTDEGIAQMDKIISDYDKLQIPD